MKKPTPMAGLVVDIDSELTFVVDVFSSIYSEFNAIPFEARLNSGTYAVAILNYESWGVFYQLAVALLAAHQLAKTFSVDYGEEGRRDQGSTGIVTSKSASTSSLSESNSISSLATGDDPFSADLAQTQYGLQLLSLIGLIMPMGELVNGEKLRGYGYSQYGWPQRSI